MKYLALPRQTRKMSSAEPCSASGGQNPHGASSHSPYMSADLWVRTGDAGCSRGDAPREYLSEPCHCALHAQQLTQAVERQLSALSHGLGYLRMVTHGACPQSKHTTNPMRCLGRGLVGELATHDDGTIVWHAWQLMARMVRHRLLTCDCMQHPACMWLKSRQLAHMLCQVVIAVRNCDVLHHVARMQHVASCGRHQHRHRRGGASLADGRRAAAEAHARQECGHLLSAELQA